ncbi:hypothetical protein LTS10_004331 [Elasticomyces elasticus]|nr:hypothetical protein LTS10_004331 [Elasticomyces elasticus]
MADADPRTRPNTQQTRYDNYSDFSFQLPMNTTFHFDAFDAKFEGKVRLLSRPAGDEQQPQPKRSSAQRPTGVRKKQRTQ